MNEQDDQLGLYRVREPQNACKIQSYLISLIDGTGSMRNEYESVIKAHDMKFGCFGNNQIKYQWEEQLFPFLPFRCAEQGNISSSFKTVFEQLLSTNYPKNLTFLFISDGREPYDYNEISNLVKQIKEKYYIQFICVTVGDSFPISISNILRKEIHNQNSDCSYLYQVERRKRPESEILSDFLQIFESIRQQLNIFSGQITLQQPVYTTLGQIHPTNIVQPNEIVVSTKPQIKQDQQILQQSNNAETQEKMIKKTIVNLLTENPKNQEEIQTKCILIEQRNSDICKNLQQSETNSDAVETMTEMIFQIKDKNLRLQDLSEQETTKIQAALNKNGSSDQKKVMAEIITKQNPDAASKINVSVTKMKAAHYSKSKCLLKQTNWESEAFNQLQLILQGLESKELKDPLPALQNLRVQTENEISRLQQISDTKKERLVIIAKLISLIKFLDSVLQQRNSDLQQIINNIKKFFYQQQQITEPYADNSQDLYYLKYKNINQVLDFANEIASVKCNLKQQLTRKMKNAYQEEIELFHKTMTDCLNSMICKFKGFKQEKNDQSIQSQVFQQIKDIILELKQTFPAIYKNLEMGEPQNNSLYFKKTIGILYHLDTSIYKQNQSLSVDQVYKILDECNFSKGFVNDFIESVEALASCDFDYLYR